MATMEHYEVPEAVEAGLTGIVVASDHTGFVAVESPRNFTRDRDFFVLDNMVPRRKSGSGGCCLWLLEVTVTVFYGAARVSRRRRLSDAGKVAAALEDLRPTHDAISRVTITPAANGFDEDAQYVLNNWNVQFEYYSTEA